MSLSPAWPPVEVFDDHRLWRPEWTADRSCLYWYLTFVDQPSVATLAVRASGQLADQGAVDCVPPRWLHLTLCDVGFLDEVEPARLEAMTEAVTGELRLNPPLDLTLGPIGLFSDAVALAAGPTPSLLELRQRIGRAMESVGLVGEQHGPAEFWPHVTLGYLNRRTDKKEVLAALGEAEATATVRVDHVTLAAVSRRDGHYQWDAGAVLRLEGGGTSQSEGTVEPRTTGSESTP